MPVYTKRATDVFDPVDGSGNPRGAAMDDARTWAVEIEEAIDDATAGFRWNVEGADAATTAALPANTYANGTLGVGATLTATANGALANQDGVAMSVGSRLLVKDEASQLKNGLYSVTQVGDGSNPYILTRVTDADTAADLDRMGVTVGGGSTQQGFQYLLQLAAAEITVGTTSLVFGLFSSQSGLAPINSPAFTGTPTVPTATAGDVSTQIASTEFVDAYVLDSIKIEPDPFPLIDLKPTFWWHPKAHAKGDSRFAMTIAAAQAFGANGLLAASAAGAEHVSYRYQTGERLGYRIEGIDRVQLATAPRDLTNAAWTKTSCTAAKNALGIDGVSNTATTLTATGANATCTQAITSASAKRAVSVWLKRGSGTGDIQITADGSTYTTVTLTSNFQEFRIPIATITDPVIGIKIVTSGNIVIVDYFECKTDNYSTPNPVGTGTVAADVITFPMPAYNTVLGNWLYFRGTVYPNGVAQSLVCMDLGATTTRVQLGIDTSNLIHLWVSNGGSTVVDMALPEVVVSGQEVVIAARLKVNDYRLVGRDFTPVVDTSGAMPANMTTVRLGRNFGGEGAVCDYVALGFGTGDIDDITLATLIDSGADVLDEDVLALKLKAADNANKEFSRLMRERPIGDVAGATRAYNGLHLDGQSISRAAEAWPRLTGNSLLAAPETAMAGTLMMGDDVRSTNTDASGWTQHGSAAFTALIAKVIDGSGTVLSDAAAAALTPGDGHPGENLIVTATRVLKREIELARGVEGDTAQQLVAFVTGVGGKSLNELREGHLDGSVEYFEMVKGAFDLFDTLSGVSTHHIVANGWQQGETDSLVDHGLSNRADYKTALGAVHASFNSHAASRCTNDKDAILLLTPPGGTFVRDLDHDGARDQFVTMAQWEYARENPGVVALAGPYYHVTDKENGHLDANGQRWLGAKWGQVLAHTVLRRKQWHCASVLEVEWVGARRLWVHLDLPHPKAQTQNIYQGVDTSTMSELLYAQRGFRVRDAAGNMIVTVTVVADTILQIDLTRTPTGTVYLEYATEAAHSGNGNICDSDPFDPGHDYLYDAATGQYANADIAALVDLPYPMRNVLLNFAEAVTSGWDRRDEL